MRTISSLAAVATLTVLAACGSSSTGPGCSPAATRVCLANTAFNRAVDTAAVGSTVTFRNTDGFTHTVTASSVPQGATLFDKTVSGGSSTTVTFNVAGTYEYYCTIHGTPTTGMHARIVIQ
jgi:plastocyanin